MLKFYYNPFFKYTNRTIIDLDNEVYVSRLYENIDSADTINAHIIYELESGENIPTYVVDSTNNRRYFVSGITQLRTGKFQLSLLRDLVSESDFWLDEEAFVISGKATNHNKYKRYNLPFTNTKIGEQRLNINGRSSFFVYYVNTQKRQDDVVSEEDLEIKSVSVNGVTGFDFEVSNLNEIPGYTDFVNKGPALNWKSRGATMRVLMDTGGGFFGASKIRNYYVLYNNNDTISVKGYDNDINNDNIFIKTAAHDLESNENNSLTDMTTAVKNFIVNYENSLGPRISQNQISQLENYIDKIIYNSTSNKFYKIRKTQNIFSRPGENDNLSLAQTATLKSAFRNINFKLLTNTNKENLTEKPESWFWFYSRADELNYTLEEIGVGSGFDFNFSAKERKLPKSAVRCVNIVPDNDFSFDDISQTLMLAQTNNLNLNEDTGKIIDIQYLPFSIATTKNSNFKIDDIELTAQFLNQDDYSYNINLGQNYNINKETDTIKIVSPSRASQFLFRPYNNDGKMEFIAKITVRPYASIIYIRPTTKGLLLYDYDDKEALIISEDFSLTNVSSAWSDYIYSNKNFNNIFEREIQGRDFGRDWERKIEDAQREADNWTSRNISAQKAQTFTGNIPLVSGVAGAIGTAFQDSQYMQAAALDREYNEALYQESLSISRDMFRFQTDNIKSQPLIPSSITTLDVKVLDGVYLEFWSTNETEKISIDMYYKNNGNRIEDFGTIREYINNFVRAKIIKSSYYTQPEINELNRRLEAGVFLTGGQ